VPVILSVRKYATNDVDPDKADKDKLLPYYKGQFIASAASGIKGFADLKGKTFCFVDPNSTSGYILPSIVLRGKGINPDKDFKAVVNAGGHDKVAIGVYDGTCDAGVTFVNALTDASYNLKAKFADIEQKVTIFAVTDRIPNDGMQVSKDLPAAIKDVVITAMLAMAKDPGGVSMLTSLYNYNALDKVEPSVYDPFIKALKDSGFDIGTLIK
jgi:phosphonate transport system substrate-binding protein